MCCWSSILLLLALNNQYNVCVVVGLNEGHLKVSSSSTFPASLPGSNAGLSQHDPAYLVELLLQTDDVAEQADIIHYLFVTQ